MKNPRVSIIIPVRVSTPYLKETLLKLKQQTYKNYEILVITDKISQNSNPAFKRNLAAKMASGEILAFLDDDSYPHPHWLSSAIQVFRRQPTLGGVCGPCLTPSTDSIAQQASGLVWSTTLGSGGAGTYRNSVSSPRFVDDYPTVNLFIKKEIFQKAGGFDLSYWPGEDTILCLKITKNLKKEILYHPSVIVYHHRRPVIISHLQQITRYALHRGHFAKKFPQTSFRLGYLFPSFCVVYAILSPLLYLFLGPIMLAPFLIYLGLLTLTLHQILSKSRSLHLALLTVITIPLTHTYYGSLFIIGFLRPRLSFVAHPVNKSTGQYIGG